MGHIPTFEKFKHKNLILASKSPRRQELLKGLGLEFISEIEKSIRIIENKPTLFAKIYNSD